MTVRAVLCWCTVAGILMSMVAVTTTPTGTPRPSTVRPVPSSALSPLSHHVFVSTPTAEQCRAAMAVACFSPLQLRRAYGLDALNQRGVDGRGTTIAVVVSFGSPTVESDLREFDRTWGLPDPPSVRTITPAGALPPFDPADEEMSGWAYETTLDVQYAHVLAPAAAILVVATPVAETQGVQGFPEMMRAENYVVDHGLADVISQSFGASEGTFPGAQSILDLRGAFGNATRHHVTVLAAAGDTGAAGYQFDQATFFPTAENSWPSSDPLVTSVGGTGLRLDSDGDRTRPDAVWQDGYGSGGGGRSAVFARPGFQDGVRAIVGTRRGTPDVAMSAAVDGGVLAYASYDPAETGWSVVGGTSEATPLFAGLVALADQVAGRSLGSLNATLYQLGTRGDAGLVDVTQGWNSFGGVTGYPAGPGYDLATGWGTVDAGAFVTALAGARAGAGAAVQAGIAVPAGDHALTPSGNVAGH